MEWIEVTGKTVEAAVDTALDRLGVDEADVEYEIVDEPRRGLFGLGGTSARIRARVKPISREKPDRRRRSGGREGRGGGGRSERSGRGERKEGAGSRGAGGAGRGGRLPVGEEAAPGRPRPGGQRPHALEGSVVGLPAVAAKPPTRQNRSGYDEEESVSGYEVALEDQVDMARQFTSGLVERFGLKAEVIAREGDDDDVRVDVTGDDLGILIGPKAATLDAVQELVRTAVQRRIGGHGARIHVDVSGYRARRQAALADFAREAAGRAVESGRDQAFEPMSPSDRKVVHDVVNDIDGVSTISEGEEPRRRVVIKVT